MQINELLSKDTKFIKNFIENIEIEQYTYYINGFLSSNKKSIQNTALSMSKKLDKIEKEKNRIKEMYSFEENIKNTYNIKNILCLDEVGRGPLAGPVVVCGVILEKNPDILYINDSKKLSEEKRKEIFNKINKSNIDYEVEIIDNNKIDEVNIFAATYTAMANVTKKFKQNIEHILIDGNQIMKNINIDQSAVIKGDSKVLGIAAASIIAKVIRDDMMIEYDKVYPNYNFAKNKGYGTAEHIEALKKYGPCPIHRKSFLKNII